jgi:hypothetical protein
MENVTKPVSTSGLSTVAVAIVTSRLGVLAGRRRDGNLAVDVPGTEDRARR